MNIAANNCLCRSFLRIKKYVNFLQDFWKFDQLNSSGSKRFQILWRNRYPCLNDNTENTSYDRHYLYHQAWAARVVAKINPPVHFDISSSLNFCTTLSAFIPVQFYDYRPVNMNLNNLTSKSANLTGLPFEDNSIQSLSCMHTIEHIGLGRYGDKLDPEGDLKAISELQRVLKKNGNLLIVVPIGKPKIMFNAHRIYSYEQVLQFFDKLTLYEFSLISDVQEDGLIINASKEQADICDYGCGCFWFKKLA
jgi:predicted SAM-dependent methyltransferase